MQGVPAGTSIERRGCIVTQFYLNKAQLFPLAVQLASSLVTPGIKANPDPQDAIANEIELAYRAILKAWANIPERMDP
jgi:hypothetical protein